MPTLASGKRTTWTKNKYTHLDVDWSGGAAGSGKVSVRQGDGAATSKAPPAVFDLDKSLDGSLANNTDKTVQYTLS